MPWLLAGRGKRSPGVQRRSASQFYQLDGSKIPLARLMAQLLIPDVLIQRYTR
jgi:hypothetical protein